MTLLKKDPSKFTNKNNNNNLRKSRSCSPTSRRRGRSNSPNNTQKIKPSRTSKSPVRKDNSGMNEMKSFSPSKSHNLQKNKNSLSPSKFYNCYYYYYYYDNYDNYDDMKHILLNYLFTYFILI